jgi:hypothetical protein
LAVAGSGSVTSGHWHWQSYHSYQVAGDWYFDGAADISGWPELAVAVALVTATVLAVTVTWLTVAASATNGQ